MAEVLVAGLLCLDVIPGFVSGGSSIADVLAPGKLTAVDGVVLATGGAASNTGLSLHRLGFGVDIVGKIGDDAFGRIILDLIRRQGPDMARNMIVSPGEGSSFTIILNPPGIDRVFLHSASTNNTFGADEVPDSALDGPRLLHFGYPPIMEKFWLRDGAETRSLMERAKRRGLTTSLDMAWPDPESPAGRADWKRFLANVLPYVDVFLPSIDEILFMLDRPWFERLQAKAGEANPAAFLDADAVAGIADRLLAYGPAVVGLKLGDQGFYLKTTSDPSRLAAMGPLAPADAQAWLGCERAARCRVVKVAGTTGAGDATIAGFLAALLRGLTPGEAAMLAVGVGGASVEAMDATSGVPSWETIEKRLAAGWPEARGVTIPDAWAVEKCGARKR